MAQKWGEVIVFSSWGKFQPLRAHGEFAHKPGRSVVRQFCLKTVPQKCFITESIIKLSND